MHARRELTYVIGHENTRLQLEGLYVGDLLYNTKSELWY